MALKGRQEWEWFVYLGVWYGVVVLKKKRGRENGTRFVNKRLYKRYVKLQKGFEVGVLIWKKYPWTDHQNGVYSKNWFFNNRFSTLEDVDTSPAKNLLNALAAVWSLSRTQSICTLYMYVDIRYPPSENFLALLNFSIPSNHDGCAGLLRFLQAHVLKHNCHPWKFSPSTSINRTLRWPGPGVGLPEVKFRETCGSKLSTKTPWNEHGGLQNRPLKNGPPE